jgi:hypothetical protein
VQLTCADLLALGINEKAMLRIQSMRLGIKQMMNSFDLILFMRTHHFNLLGQSVVLQCSMNFNHCAKNFINIGIFICR